MLLKRPLRHVALPLLAVSLCAASTASAAAPAATNGAVAKPMPKPKSRAKNVILFVGDGMGIATITAARIFDGQSRGESGEENSLSFESFPNVALVKTYNTNQMVPDSAGTATALNSGVKTRAGMLNIGPAAHLGDCAESKANVLTNLGEIAKANGKGLGIVTTTTITHATPGAVYAHTPQRGWENDSVIPEAERAAGCTDIATQLVSIPFDIALGGGTSHFFGKDKGGRRIDPAADLPSAWAAKAGGVYVTNRTALSAAANGNKPVLGLFAPSHLTFMVDRTTDSTEPTLSEMTTAAIDHLKGQKDGYYLMIEGGKIDHGHHTGTAGKALTEAQEFSRAIATALSKVDLKNTLVLVTADHSHVMTIAGYPSRGSPILGLAMANDARGDPTGKPIMAADGQPYTILGYQNGPGAVRSSPRPAPDTGVQAKQQALVLTGNEDNPDSIAETHGGEDVALFATGPGSENARGVIEQNRVFDIIMAATGWKRK